MRYARRQAIEAAPMQDETILFDPERNRFCVLNTTAALLWSKLDQPATTEQLSGLLCAEYADLTLERAAGDVAAALAELQQLSLVHEVS